jgi:hypothetical protein
VIRMGKESKLSPAEVVERAVKFFGPAGVGLTVADQGACCARFEGGGGYVFVQTANVDDQKGSDVTVEGREWERQVKDFIGKI